ncbi:hypothetical protein RFI_18133 [Reticulomyxa filosa]|uniref:Uncharacterized protein n=1 Tax=Reticulomyxa filosa TaxID=46433 RepID=X6MYJ0_RETFI|nr:hypothetical protein RFI_18133 [Reticulomyxa filosa]|eukprot:ETO19105.1 hypothetical protein RFI_18133 [Reticulomyxa filosa]
MVYRFFSSGTLEENIYMRQLYKQQIAKISSNEDNCSGSYKMVKKQNSAIGKSYFLESEIRGIKAVLDFKPKLNQSMIKNIVERCNEYYSVEEIELPPSFNMEGVADSFSGENAEPSEEQKASHDPIMKELMQYGGVIDAHINDHLL